MEIELWLVERDGTRIAPLHGSLNFDFCEWELNGVGSASLTGNPTSRNVDRIEGVRNEIQIWIDGDCMWWGPVLGLSGGPIVSTSASKVSSGTSPSDSCIARQTLIRCSTNRSIR
jgi:hypothetical protein